ncbi:hypothetical protein K445DRAFT_53455, partial [Daldinia sp. EC12]
KKTYNTGDSLVVTDPTTSPAVSSLSMGERTGSRVFCFLWSYVEEGGCIDIDIDIFLERRQGDEPITTRRPRLFSFTLLRSNPKLEAAVLN